MKKQPSRVWNDEYRDLVRGIITRAGDDGPSDWEIIAAARPLGYEPEEVRRDVWDVWRSINNDDSLGRHREILGMAVECVAQRCKR